MCTQIGVAVVEHQRRVLIGQRPPGVPLAGSWEFPGGKVRSGESPAEAAVRECLEETGIAVRMVRELETTVHAYAHETVELHFFLCLPQDEPPLVRAPFRWVSCEQLAAYQFPDANRSVLERLQRRACSES
jgi:mutator protein MutT